MKAQITANINESIRALIEQSKARNAKQVEDYRYEWDTAEQLIANIHTERRFRSYGVASISDYTDDPEVVGKAHELWLKLRDAFNREARGYDPELFMSRLGSVGEVTRREVLRSAWWDTLGGDAYGDYDTLTGLIELLHDEEQLETGTIVFGS